MKHQCSSLYTYCSETLTFSSEELEEPHKVLQETGLGGDKEVKEDAVVEGDALKQEQEVAVRVTARGAGCLENISPIEPRALSASEQGLLS